MWQMTAFYGPEANALWRRDRPDDPRPGPQEGEIAIQVQGPESVVQLDAMAARLRPEIGEVFVVQLRGVKTLAPGEGML